MSPKLAEAIDPIFLRALKGLDEIEHGATVAPRQLQQEILGLTYRADEIIGGAHEWKLSRYTIIAWIDEMLVDACAWEHASWWAENSLEVALFDIKHAAGWMQHEAEQSATDDDIEVILVCLLLGFRGVCRAVESSSAVTLDVASTEEMLAWARNHFGYLRSHTSVRHRVEDRQIWGAPPAPFLYQAVGSLDNSNSKYTDSFKRPALPGPLRMSSSWRLHQSYRRGSLLRPHLAVQHPIIHGFLNVMFADGVCVFEVGDGAGEAEDFVVGSSGKAHVIHAVFQECMAALVQFAVLANLFGVHLRVAHNPAIGKSITL